MAASVRPGGDAASTRLTGAVFGLVAIGVVGGITWLAEGGDLGLGIAVAALCAPVLDGFLANRTVRRSIVSLEPPDVIEVSRPSDWRVSVSGTADRAVSLTVMLLRSPFEVVSIDTEPGVVEVMALQRGPLPFAVVDVQARGPLGLVRCARRHLLPFPSWPAVVPAPQPHPARWPRPQADGFGMDEGAPIGDDLFRSIRPYRRGDERRKVDWKSTARHGELMVRESDGLGIIQVRVVVDLGPPGPLAEMVACWASWVALESLRRGWVVEMVTLDGGGRAVGLRDLGRPIRGFPTVDEPFLDVFPTVTGPVRSPREVGLRLATAAYGTPAAAATNGRLNATCHVTPAGVAWR